MMIPCGLLELTALFTLVTLAKYNNLSTCMASLTSARKRGVLILIVAAVCVVGFALSWRMEDWAKNKAIAELEKRYDRRVELKSLSMSLLSTLRISGRGLVVHQKDDSDPPPFIAVKSFTAEIPLRRLFRRPVRLDKVVLQGLRINVPTGKPKEPKPPPSERPNSSVPGFVIDRITADGTTLTILPKHRDDDPLVFDIERLALKSVGVNLPMRFETALRNAKPPGMINSAGYFGPWSQDEPGQTPVSGDYTFRDADLGVFKGISGTLSSVGRYSGVLERIVVDGETDTPNFGLDVSRHTVDLKTEFHAIVDGTNGDTLLQPVNAHFLRTSILANGGVVGTPGKHGKSIRLDVAVSKSRVEDLLTLAIKNQRPPLAGWVTFRTQFELPPGPEDVIYRLNLKGRFGISSAEFTDFKVQKKVKELSERARGNDDEDTTDERIVSDLGGEFTLNHGKARFAKLSFRVPGATIQLNGDYGLLTEDLDFGERSGWTPSCPRQPAASSRSSLRSWTRSSGRTGRPCCRSRFREI